MLKKIKKLLRVHKDYKTAIGWSIPNIKGINLFPCMHKTLMEDEFNASIEHQCELNSNMQEVVRVDVMKLLDANIFYSISNSCNGESSTGCVYKKKDHGGSKRKQ